MLRSLNHTLMFELRQKLCIAQVMRGTRLRRRPPPWADGPRRSRVTAMFTGAQRNKALGVWAAVGRAGVAIGVIVGGVLTSAAGWRWVFFINLPVGLGVLALLPLLVSPAPARADRGRVDVPGA